MTHITWIWILSFSSATLFLLCILFILCLIITIKSKNEYFDQWSKWENEYWMLRRSEAIDDKKYDIHLSWVSRGFYNCIEEKQKLEVKEEETEVKEEENV